MNIREIVNGIYYCGVNDRVTHLFEAMWELPNGVSYNSYIVKGEKTALIDCVEVAEIVELIHNIKEVISDAPLDYLVVNHNEPDHSGGIPILLEAYPELKIIGNRQTVGMLKGYYKIPDDRLIEIKAGDEMDLGGMTLRFILTPMVHWPETMMTYVPEREVLFTGDAFGTFGALNGGIIDNELDCDIYIEEMYRYYSNIVGKYGKFVQRALAAVSGLKIEYACPTHGPVWHDKLKEVTGIYDRLSRYEPDKKMATIVYGSMYGNTAAVAEEIARRLAARGIRKIRVYNAASASLSRMISDAFRSEILIVGCPTYSMTLFPAVDQFVKAMATREIKNKTVATFGSYTWSPAAPKLLEEAFADMGLPPVATLSMKQSADAATWRDVDTMVDAVMNSLS